MKRKLSLLKSSMVVLSTVATLSVFQAKAAEENVMSYLPSVSELYTSVNSMGIGADWKKTVKVTSKNYDGMDEIERAFEVGTTLSDVAFVLSTLEKGEKPDDKILLEAEKAISSLNPGSETLSRLERMRSMVGSGKLEPAAMREELDALVSQIFPALRGNKDIQDAANLALAAASFKVMYLGADSVSGLKEPSKEQLGMFRWSSIARYFKEYFENEAGDKFKNSDTVKTFVAAISEIEPLIGKAPGKIAKQDIEQVRDYLAAVYQ